MADRLAFRGGTAIHKLLLRQPLRYSEDIDLVQRRAEPIGPTVNALRDVLSWLGPCQRDTAAHSLHLNYRFTPETEPTVRAKVKVEIDTREHEYLYGVRTYPFAVENPWFTGQAAVVSFEPEELFGTKLRALLQRRKGRDLFDFHVGFEQLALDATKVLAVFEHYAGPTPRGCGSPRRRRAPRRPSPSPPSTSPLTACRARRSRPERAP